MSKLPLTRILLALKTLTPEEKVLITADMSDAVTRICLERIKKNNPGFSDRDSYQLLRERNKQRRR